MKLSTTRKFLASFLLIPPVLWLVSTLVGPDTGNGSSTHDQLKALNKIAAHKSAFLVSGYMFLLAAMLFIVATYGIVHVYRGRKLGVGQVAGGLLAMGMSVFFAFFAFGISQYTMVNHAAFNTPGTRQLFAQLEHYGQNSGPGTPLFLVFVVGLVLGPILLGVAMIRRRNVPLWAGILVIITGPAGFFADGKAANTVFQLVLLAGLTPLALLIWRMTDEEWDAPRDVVGQRQAAPSAVPVEPTPTPALP